MPSLSLRFSMTRKLLIASAALFPLLSTTHVGAAEPTKVRYEEVVRSVLYMPMYVALNQGYFKEAGLDVSLKTSQGTDKGMAALLSGSADIVLVGPEASVYVANSESPVKPKVFAGLTATDGFLLLSRKPVKEFDWTMLKGKSVMSFRPGSNPDVFLETALRKHNLNPKADVKMISNIGPAARAGAWMAGQADYAIFLEPEASNLEKSGQGQVVASIGREVGPVDFTSFTATDAYLKKNPKVAQAWTNAIFKAQKYVQDAPPAALAQHISAYFPGISEGELVTTINRYRQYDLWKKTPAVEEAAMEKLQDMLIASGLLENDKRVKYDRIVDTTFAREAK
ncbi:ABC transporter substrate-binding protein [Candidimonas sp. SYP-B2681]|uniref:ABC transporter substrate-binding protein n=1 Tax=Candidimonas sp. SYP-B2681 TaxID=2497686 RepID=UPI001F465B47|nr:ABC transporter substrate-binding protein [Candidimonas sp. SYP-B2681]